jgi:hypothetical protein
MIHQPLTTQSNSPSCIILPESPPEQSFLDVFGSEDNPLRNHFQSILKLPASKLIGVFIVYALITKMLVASFLKTFTFYAILNEPDLKAISASAMMAEQGIWMTFLNALILAPVVETLINQWFPLWVTVKTTQKPVFAIWFSTILFGICHINAGLFGFFITASTGFYLAIAFLHGRQFSRSRAFCTTAAIHAGVNGIAISFALLTQP